MFVANVNIKFSRKKDIHVQRYLHSVDWGAELEWSHWNGILEGIMKNET